MKDSNMAIAQEAPPQKTLYAILLTISFAHMVNDTLQAVIPAIYPLIKSNFGLSFTQIGLVTFTYQIAASILQPFVGFYTDKKSRPYSLAVGMTFTLTGLVLMAFAMHFAMVLIAVGVVGIGSSIFHPEASRIAHLASGGKKGLAQSIFQLGGNTGSAIGPLLAALIIGSTGQVRLLWFTLLAIVGIVVLVRIGNWYKLHHTSKAKTQKAMYERVTLSRSKIIFSLCILLLLIFSKYFYLSSMTSYYTFYLIDKFHLTVKESQFYLFIFLAAVAAGTVLGGPLGDRFGRKYIIWISILGAAPFTLLLPYVNLPVTCILSVFIGLIIASAFSAILVYAQELVPGKVGTISGLFFGLAFGMGGLGSAVLGKLADMTSITYVYKVCAFLPLLGIFTAFLPNIEKKIRR
ncbi:MAG: MFS transporter [Filimonas sp.]|nr:MFS transporter [Filimonas sp.]